MRKSIAAAGITASLLAGSFVGAAVLPSGIGLAQEGAPAEETVPGEGDHAAERFAWVVDAIDGLVDNGTINREQGDAVLQALKDNAPHPGENGHHQGRPGMWKKAAEAAAEVIGISTDELIEALKSGSSVAEVAEANGVSTQALIDGLVAKAEEALAEAVESGRLTQEQADRISAGLVGRITSHVQGNRPIPPLGGPGKS